MKIAVTAKGAGLGAWLDPVFETCLQIVIVDDQDRFEAWMNPYREASPKDGIALAEKLIDEKVNILITGTISPQAKEKLVSSGVEVFTADKGSILEIVEAACDHTLSLAV